MKKRFLTLALALTLCAGLAVPAAAVADTRDPMIHYSDQTVQYGSYVVKEDGSLWTTRVVNEYDDTNGDTFHKAMDGVKSVWTVDTGAFILKSDHSLWSWAGWGHLSGDGTENYHKRPVKIMDDVLNFQYGDSFGGELRSYCVIKSDGSLWTWGDYTGDGTAERRLAPTKVMESVAMVLPVGSASDQLITYAVKKDGSLWGWGHYDDRHTPFTWDLFEGVAASGTDCLKPVKLMDDVIAVTSDNVFYDMALRSDGSLWYWGRKKAEDNYVYAVKPEKLMDGVAAVDGSAVIKTDGSLWMLRTNFGIITPEKYADNVARVSDENGYMLKTDGTLWTMPYNASEAKPLLSNVVACSGYWNFGILMLRSDGSLWGYGDNNDRGLGIGNKSKITTPVKVMDHVRLPSKTGVSEPGSPFDDVRSSQYFYQPVKWAVADGITTGTGATTFSPDQTCTRGQIITFLWRAAGSPEPENAIPFSDVKEDAYYAKATAWAAEQGMEEGAAFSPDAPCTRLMAVEFMWKYADSPEAPKATFTDVASDAVNWAVKQGVTNGTSATTFSPEQTCTRGQIVTFLYRGFAD